MVCPMEQVTAEASKLVELIPLYFDATDYPNVDFASTQTKKAITRLLFDFLSECNRCDIPDDAKIPFLNIAMQFIDAQHFYKKVIDNQAVEGLSKDKPTQSVSIKSTSVTYGKSEFELAKDDAKTYYADMVKAIERDWIELIARHRKLRW